MTTPSAPAVSRPGALGSVPLIQRLLILLAVRNAVRGGVDEATLLQVDDVDSLVGILEANELMAPHGPAPWRVALRPVEPGDLPGIYRAWCDPEAAGLWRAPGTTPSWADLESQLWAGTEMLLVGADTSDGSPAALVCSYAENAVAGWVYAAVLRLDAGRGGPFIAMEAFYLLMRQLFDTRPYRKVMLEIPARTFWMADGVVPPEDVSLFPAHRYVGGEWVDVAHVHVWRRHWDRLREPVDVVPQQLGAWLRHHVGRG